MNKVVKGCLTFVLQYAGIALLYFFTLLYFSSNPYNFHLAIMGSFFALLFFGGFKSFVVPGVEEKTIKKYQTPTVFEDGDYIAAIGQIHPIGKPLTSPLQNFKCVSYEYDIYRIVSSHDSSHKESDFIGFARTPGKIRTDAGDIRISEYMDLNHFPEKTLKYEDINKNAAEYIARTKFETLKSDFKEVLAVAKDAFKGGANDLVKEMKSLTRSDRRNPKAKLDPNHNFTERCVEVGQEVCALGIYSSKAKAIVSQPELEGHANQIIPGNAKQALSLFKRKKYFLFLGTLFGFLLSHGIIYYVVSNFVE